MGTIEVSAEGTVDAAAELVYGCLADMQRHHPHFLPPEFSAFTVVDGGVGAGTVVTFTVTAGGRSRDYRMTVAEPEPGRRMTETDANSSLVTTFEVIPDGGRARVRISTRWQGAGGVGGFFERLFAPRVMRGIYVDELDRLDAYVRQLD
ncbi:MAG: SRPBCC family protein [Thermocrispum sp.]